jgi:hypothetical protein
MITIKELSIDNESAEKIINLIKKHEPKIWNVLKVELKEAFSLTDVVNCNCYESKQLEEEFEINHLINDTYQVVGKDSSTVWKQGTMEECNDWVML